MIGTNFTLCRILLISNDSPSVAITVITNISISCHPNTTNELPSITSLRIMKLNNTTANISENVLSYITNSLSLGNRFLALEIAIALLITAKGTAFNSPRLNSTPNIASNANPMPILSTNIGMSDIEILDIINFFLERFSSKSSAPSNTISINPTVPIIGSIGDKFGMLMPKKSAAWRTAHPTINSSITDGIFVFGELTSNIYDINNNKHNDIMIVFDILNYNLFICKSNIFPLIRYYIFISIFVYIRIYFCTISTHIHLLYIIKKNLKNHIFYCSLKKYLSLYRY